MHTAAGTVTLPHDRVASGAPIEEMQGSQWAQEQVQEELKEVTGTAVLQPTLPGMLHVATSRRDAEASKGLTETSGF